MVEKTVFATVGTTKFDLLVSTLTQPEVLNELKQKGYTNVIIQRGNGNFEPDEEKARELNVNLTHYRFKKSLQDDIINADLVISHAGAGTCLEVLESGKPLLVVVNEELMHNHQTELADQLSSEGYLFACTCKSLLQTIKNSDLRKLKKMRPIDSKLFANYLDEFMGFKKKA